MRKLYNEIFNFWFSLSMKQWFSGKDKRIDETIKKRFEKVIQLARQKKLDEWKKSPKSLLALIIVLDQFPRNAYRGSKKAYTHSNYAVVLSHYGFKNYRNHYDMVELMFLLLPLQHSESLTQQKYGIQYLYQMFRNKKIKSIQELKDLNLTLYHQLEHYEVIKKFGRFPKRNSILKRKSTPEEIKYINQSDTKDRLY